MINAAEQKKHFDQKSYQYSESEIMVRPYFIELECKHIESFLPKRKIKIVDFGCGSGRIAMYFLEKGHDVLAVDISQESIKVLVRLYKTKKRQGWGRLTTSTEIVGNNFDAIVGADVLHHVVIEKEVKNLKKFLKKDGVMVFSEPNALNPLWYVHYFLKKISWSIERGILACTSWNLKKTFTKVVGHGLLPTRLIANKYLSKFNALYLGNFPILKTFCFRFIVVYYLAKSS